MLDLAPRHLAAFGLLVLVGSGLALGGCKKESPRGACVVSYDDMGEKGDACTVVPEDQCNDNGTPAVKDMASMKKQSFTAGKACKDAGYAAVCKDSPIAWSFKSCQ